MSAPQGAGRRHGGEAASGGQASAGAYPSPTVTLVGRAVEIGEVRDLVAANRMVTLIGPGGMGKTSLADAVAQNPPPGVEGCSFVSLATISEASLIPVAVADTLGLRATEGKRPLDLIVEHVGSQRHLLVLDNLEHLPEAASSIVGLLDRCCELRVLATSRAPLRISREWVYEVPALQTPSSAAGNADPTQVDAVALFLQRARATGAFSESTPADIDTIAEICDRLEGLPLAIELAASRVRHMPLRSISANLDDALILLDGGAVDAPERHRGLDRTIAWSYDLLGRPEAVIFGRLGVFVGSFEPGAVRAVASDLSSPTEIEILNTLSRLVDQSLLRQAPSFMGRPRYCMHEVIRQFALSVIDDEDLARQRHLSHYLDLAEEAEHGLSRADQSSWVGLLSLELPNLRAALSWSASSGDRERLLRLAAALGGYWRRSGDPREGLDWLEQARSSPELDDPRLQARAGYHAARLLVDEGDRDRALGELEEASRFADEAGDIAMGARTRAGIGVVRLMTGHEEEASAPIDEAVTIARRSGDPGLLSDVLEAEAFLRGSLGQSDASEALWSEMIELERLNGNKRALANGLLNLANLRLVQADYPESARLIEDAISTLGGFEADNNLPFAHLMLGVVRSQLGNLEGARESIEQGATSVLRGPVAQDHIFATEAIAEWLGAADSHEEALKTWAAAERARAVRNIPYELVDEGWLKGGIARDRSSVTERIAKQRWKEGQATDIDDAIRLGLAAMRVAGQRGQRRQRSVQEGPETLTPREREVLALLAEGRTDRGIADVLFISPKTASVHVANIKGKLGASSRVDIVMTAIRAGLVETSPGT